MRNEPIPALTGLRFFAALLVVISHAMPKIVPMDAPPQIWIALHNSAGIAMPLFFVLSGFVIHYNYGSLIRNGKFKDFYKFYLARFARLYPLFILVVALDLTHAWSYSQMPGGVGESLPYYLTLSQSWVYVLVGVNALIYKFGIMSALTWSISVE